jgi:FAD/FMN-containing dehydrogenase
MRDDIENNEPMIAVVLYINIWNTESGMNRLRKWTRELIDIVLNCSGRYYLPYLPLATLEQFEMAYPEIHIFRKLKQKYDPHNILRSQFINTYISV